MFPESEYRLEDIAHGRRLEFWAGVLVDRPIGSPAEVRDKKAGPWPEAELVFEVVEANRGVWHWRGAPRQNWMVRAQEGFRLVLRPNSFGHLGVFPEHSITWPWVAAQRDPARVLNLFAHTGGATLAAAQNGECITHVDSAPSMRKWGRYNAHQCGMDETGIHWITEDATKFAERELRRGHQYDALILDPPTFGRGPKKEIWRIDESLPRLLATCRELLSPNPVYALLTCHTPGYTPLRLAKLLSQLLPTGMKNVRTRELILTSRTGKRLSCGAAAYWSRDDIAM